MHLLNSYSLPGTILGIEYTAVDKTDKRKQKKSINSMKMQNSMTNFHNKYNWIKFP